MHKRFFTKSILLQGFVGGVLFLLLVMPSIKDYSSHPLLSILGIVSYLILVPTIGMLIEVRVK